MEVKKMPVHQKMIDKDINIALKKHGGFFAFGNDQFKKAHNPKLKYISLGSGLYAPKKTYKNLIIDIEKAIQGEIELDLRVNSIKDIIWRELANYECQIVGSVSDCVDALKGHGITKKQIMNEYPAYFDYCIENNYF
jgi:hypothetical protein